jgi:hypothetical protein
MHGCAIASDSFRFVSFRFGLCAVCWNADGSQLACAIYSNQDGEVSLDIETFNANESYSPIDTLAVALVCPDDDQDSDAEKGVSDEDDHEDDDDDDDDDDVSDTVSCSAMDLQWFGTILYCTFVRNEGSIVTSYVMQVWCTVHHCVDAIRCEWVVCAENNTCCSQDCSSAPLLELDNINQSRPIVPIVASVPEWYGSR